MGLLEVGKGCGRGCRFCMGEIYRPVRHRHIPAILRAAETAMQHGRRIALVGACVSDYPWIDDLVVALRAKGADISLSSVRADSLRAGLVQGLLESGTQTLTIAPEAGTERLRTVIHGPMDGAFLGKPLQAGLLMFALGNEKLAIHDGRAWHALPTAPSPVAGWRAISSVIMTQPNQFILRTDQPSGQSAVLTLPSIRLTTNNPRLGSFDKPHAMARPEVESDVPADARVLFYRVDLGKWEPLTADGQANLGFRSRGSHRLTVWAAGKNKLSVSGHLTFEFETTYDLEEYIGPTIRQLGAEEHATREAATKTLIDCGEAVVPLMTRLLAHDDPEVVMRAKQIIQKLTQSTP